MNLIGMRHAIINSNSSNTSCCHPVRDHKNKPSAHYRGKKRNRNSGEDVKHLVQPTSIMADKGPSGDSNVRLVPCIIVAIVGKTSLNSRWWVIGNGSRAAAAGNSVIEVSCKPSHSIHNALSITLSRKRESCGDKRRNGPHLWVSWRW